MSSVHPPLTPEQVRILEENRLKAKARLQERDRLARQNAPPASALNAFNKRPLEVISADSTSPTAPNSRTFPSNPYASTSASVLGASSALQQATAGSSHRNANNVSAVTSKSANKAPAVASTSKGKGLGIDNAPLRRDPKLGKYFEYDLSTLKNTKGGFLLAEEEDDERIQQQRQLEEDLRKQRLREMQRKDALAQDPPLSIDPAAGNPKCEICGSIELDFQIHKIFGVPVCPKCKHDNPDRYSLLTKTECKEDYLLTDPELKDSELLPHLLKPNPHRATYSNMMLYLRQQVEAFAFSEKKWGSSEALDVEFERRETEKKKKKSQKFEAKLKELRKRTRTNKWHERKDAEHTHDFGSEVVRGADGGQRQVCAGCGLEIEVETF